MFRINAWEVSNRHVSAMRCLLLVGGRSVVAYQNMYLYVRCFQAVSVLMCLSVFFFFKQLN